MQGDFGVFDGVELIAEFVDDESADAHRRLILGLDSPEWCRTSEYNETDLFVARIPDGIDGPVREYELWMRLLTGLRVSRARDRGRSTLRRLSGAA